MDVGTLVARATTAYRDRIAVESEEGSLTFGEIGGRIFQLARALKSLGLAEEDRVLDLQFNQITYIESDLGISSAGLCRVALNYRLHPNDWVRIAKDCGAKVLIMDHKFWEESAPVRELVDTIILIHGEEPGTTSYEAFLASEPAEPLSLSVNPDTLVSLNYSSGTTGNPKGAIRTHRNRIASLNNIVTDILKRTPDESDCWIHAGPVTHTSGLFVLPYFAFGAKQIIMSKYEPELLVDAIANRGANATALVPTMVARLLAMPDMSLEKMKNLRLLGYAGAPMPPEQIKQCYETITPNMVQYYGLVEAIPPVTVLSAEDHKNGIYSDPQLLTSAGTPCVGVEILIVDEENNPVPVGEIGEVITRGDHVMRGYWGAAGMDATVTKAVRDGWLHTGDLGRISAENRLYLVDRKGDMIISGGYNIYPREIEDVVAELEEVLEVAVVGVKDVEWGQRVVTMVTLKPGVTATESEISEKVMAYCKSRMASYKKPKEVHVVAEFPLNSTGKIAKKVLRQQLEERVSDEK
jgi:acyl-CoA synthetase (AMP-forming)/AMP-acid ligase II